MCSKDLPQRLGLLAWKGVKSALDSWDMCQLNLFHLPIECHFLIIKPPKTGHKWSPILHILSGCGGSLINVMNTGPSVFDFPTSVSEQPRIFFLHKMFAEMSLLQQLHLHSQPIVEDYYDVDRITQYNWSGNYDHTLGSCMLFQWITTGRITSHHTATVIWYNTWINSPIALYTKSAQFTCI